MSQFSHIEISGKRRHNSCTAKTSGVSDISRDYSQVTPKKRHKWNLEEQVTLLLLTERYENIWSEKKKIFNSYVGDELNSPHDFSEGALRTMHRELKNKFSGPFGSWCGVRKALENKATLLRVPLIDRIQASPPRTPLNSRFGQFITGLPTPTSSKGIYRQTRIPRLGFRAFDISNQGVNSSTEFRAGCFINGDIPVPPSPHSFAYRNDARRQIERVHEGVTPFISTTSSLLRALSYAYRTKYPSSIAVIDLHKAGKVEDYEDDSNPFLQNVYKLNLKPKDPYKGKSEWLIYGEITEEAILCVLTLTQLLRRLPSLSCNDDPFGFQYLLPSEQLLESSKPLSEIRSLIRKISLPTNFSTGYLVGGLLKALELPMDYLNDGVCVISKDWGFRGWRSIEAFQRGVSNGFQKDHVTQLPELDLLGCSKLKTSLQEAAGYFCQETVHEEFKDTHLEEMCWSSDTTSEYSSVVQEPSEFSFNTFMQDLRKAAEF